MIRFRTLVSLLVVAGSVLALSPVTRPSHSVIVAGTVQPLHASALLQVAAGRPPPEPSECLRLVGLRCYQPAHLAQAYHYDRLHAEGLDGRGRTIAIVVPFGSPTILGDLQAFDRTFGLPDPPSFNVIQPVGPVSPFDPKDPARALWAGEATLDVEWSHAVAPGAAILLVETPVDETEGVHGMPELVQAENYVVDHNLADIISQSFGATEQTFPNRAAIVGLRSAFENAAVHRVTVLAASGDTGATGPTLTAGDYNTNPAVLWPSSDPLVTSVGGTTLTLDDSGHHLQPDAVWNDQCGSSGGGVSSAFARPSFQNRVGGATGSHRGTPDISMNADPVLIYASYQSGFAGLQLACGTSESAPLFSGVVAMADQLAGRRLGLLNAALYRLHDAGLVDVTAGSNGFGPFTNTDGRTYSVDGYPAVQGYDLASGLGTLDAAALTSALAKRGEADDTGRAP